jgi:hypothetical protein
MTKNETENIETIHKEKMNYRIINRHPEDNSKNTKDIEKRLFEIFKKYENS